MVDLHPPRLLQNDGRQQATELCDVVSLRVSPTNVLCRVFTVVLYWDRTGCISS